MNISNFNRWQNELIAALQQSAIVSSHNFSVVAGNSNGILVESPSGEKIRIDESSYKDYFTSISSIFPWEKSIIFANNQCKKFVEEWSLNIKE